jgi:hypothetical protein
VNFRELVYSNEGENSWVRFIERPVYLEIKWEGFHKCYKECYGSSVELKNLKNKLTRGKTGFKIFKSKKPTQGYDAVIIDEFEKGNVKRKRASGKKNKEKSDQSPEPLTVISGSELLDREKSNLQLLIIQPSNSQELQETHAGSTLLNPNYPGGRKRKKTMRRDVRGFILDLLSNHKTTSVRYTNSSDIEVNWNEFHKQYQQHFNSSIVLNNLKNLITRKKYGFRTKKPVASEGYDVVLEDIMNPKKIESPVNLAQVVTVANCSPVDERQFFVIPKCDPLAIMPKPSEKCPSNDTIIHSSNTNTDTDLLDIEKKIEDLCLYSYCYHRELSEKDTEVILIQSYLTYQMPCYLLRTNNQTVFFSLIEPNNKISHSIIYISNNTNLKNSLEFLIPKNTTCIPIPSSNKFIFGYDE